MKRTAYSFSFPSIPSLRLSFLKPHKTTMSVFGWATQVAKAAVSEAASLGKAYVDTVIGEGETEAEYYARIARERGGANVHNAEATNIIAVQQWNGSLLRQQNRVAEMPGLTTKRSDCTGDDPDIRPMPSGSLAKPAAPTTSATPVRSQLDTALRHNRFVATPGRKVGLKGGLGVTRLASTATPLDSSGSMTSVGAASPTSPGGHTPFRALQSSSRQSSFSINGSNPTAVATAATDATHLPSGPLRTQEAVCPSTAASAEEVVPGLETFAAQPPAASRPSLVAPVGRKPAVGRKQGLGAAGSVRSGLGVRKGLGGVRGADGEGGSVDGSSMGGEGVSPLIGGASDFPATALRVPPANPEHPTSGQKGPHLEPSYATVDPVKMPPKMQASITPSVWKIIDGVIPPLSEEDSSHRRYERAHEAVREIAFLAGRDSVGAPPQSLASVLRLSSHLLDGQKSNVRNAHVTLNAALNSKEVSHSIFQYAAHLLEVASSGTQELRGLLSLVYHGFDAVESAATQGPLSDDFTMVEATLSLQEAYLAQSAMSCTGSSGADARTAVVALLVLTQKLLWEIQV